MVRHVTGRAEGTITNQVDCKSHRLALVHEIAQDNGGRVIVIGGTFKSIWVHRSEDADTFERQQP